MAVNGGAGPLPSALAESLKLYEAQFFGFTPQTCMLRVYNAFQDSLYEIMLIVETVLVKKIRGPEAAGEVDSQTRQRTQKLLTFLQKRISRLTGRMERFLQSSVLQVPANVLLPEDAAHQQHPRGRERLVKLEAELAALQLRYQAEVGARQALLAELEEQEAVQAELAGLLKCISEVRAAYARGGMGWVQESFTYVLKTARRIQDALKEIGSKAEGLDEL
nr:PREDICTED: protein MIS12 homolog isoform X1 [Lepisosteus oculatus]